MKQQILSVLPGDHPWQNHLICYEEVSSTNDLAKTMAAQGAPEGTVVIAASQTSGRGRLGRSFYAPKGQGVYLSVILRPGCPPDRLLHLTCAVAVAACDAVEQCSGLRPEVKWTNDLILGNRKLGGILTELSVSSKTGLVDWAVLGIGINCCQQEQDFLPELQTMATSVQQWTKAPVVPGILAGHLIRSLSEMNKKLLTQKEKIMAAYRTDCMTVSREIMVVRGEEIRYGTATDIDSDGGLIVRFADGSIETVQSGEVSVRGLYGYV